MSRAEDSVEALAAVTELIEEILDEVCSRTEWDVATKVKDMSSRTREHSGPFFDLCEIVRAHHEAHVINCYCLRKGGIEILHMKCAEQQASGYCGHYAIYFTLTCLEACNSTSLHDVIGYLKETTSVAAFWRRYWVSVAELLQKVQKGGGDLWWPWTADHVLSGDLERSYLSYLLEADVHLKAMGGKEAVVVLHYAYGRIQDTEAQVCTVQEKINTFCASDGPGYLVFILGVTNHWVMLLAYKIPRTKAVSNVTHKHETVPEQSCGDETIPNLTDEDRIVLNTTCRGTKVGLLYLDSNNVPMLTASNEEIVKIVEKKEAERIRCKGKGYSEWKRGVIFQAFVDQRDVVQLLAECLSGQRDLRSEMVAANWTNVLNSYDDHVLYPLANSRDANLYTALLLQWLEVHCHPRSLRDSQLSLHRFGVKSLPSQLRLRLKHWISDSHQLLQQCSSTGFSVIELFLGVLEELQRCVLWT